jgi:mRNA interferase MazF
VPFPNEAPARGEIYWVNLDPVVGSEQGGRRPALVISPVSVNERLPVVVVAAITTQIRNRTSAVVPILPPGEPLQRESGVLTFQVRTLSKERLERFGGTVSLERMAAVDRGLAIAFGLR